MRMAQDMDGDPLEILAQRLINRCRQDIQAAWEQLEAAWRNLGRMPKVLAGRERGSVQVKSHSPKMPKRQPRSLAKTSPLRMKKMRATARTAFKKEERPAKPLGRL